jgi:hypothetical protein
MDVVQPCLSLLYIRVVFMIIGAQQTPMLCPACEVYIVHVVHAAYCIALASTSYSHPCHSANSNEDVFAVHSDDIILYMSMHLQTTECCSSFVQCIEQFACFSLQICVDLFHWQSVNLDMGVFTLQKVWPDSHICKPTDLFSDTRFNIIFQASLSQPFGDCLRLSAHLPPSQPLLPTLLPQPCPSPEKARPRPVCLCLLMQPHCPTAIKLSGVRACWGVSSSAR